MNSAQIINIKPAAYAGTNMAASELKPGRAQDISFTTAEARPPDDECFRLSYSFQVQQAGEYRFEAAVPPRLRGSSRFSCSFDGGEARELFHQRMVGAKQGVRFLPDPVPLAAGQHIMELRLYPEQRVRFMNRVTEAFERHSVQLEELRLIPATAALAIEAIGDHFALRSGDRVVFFGDSITDEEIYPEHAARLVRALWPRRGIEFINAGISLNRAPDALERLERDVLALAPDRVIICLGVNDAMQISPAEFAVDYEQILKRLHAAGIQVVCVTPPGFHDQREPQSARYIHTRDRILAFDRTASHNAAAVITLAAKFNCLTVDALTLLRSCDLPRDRLMANQWHPNSQGGRLMAIQLLRCLGMTHEDVQRSGQPLDREFYEVAMNVPKYEHPEFRAGRETPLPPSDKLPEQFLAVLSYTDNEMLLLNIESGRELARIKLGHHPAAAVYSRKNDCIYVVTEGPGELEVLLLKDLPARRKLVLEDNFYPTCIALSEDEDTAWVGGYYGSGVMEIDLATLKVKRAIAVGGYVQALMPVDNERKLLLGTPESVLLLELESGEISQRAAIEFAGRFIINEDGSVGVIDTVFWQLRTLELPTLRTIGAPTAAPFRTRAFTRAMSTGQWWVGDWERQALLCYAAAAKEEKTAVPVSFPFSVIAVADRQ